MLSTTFYHGTIRRYVIVFGTLFNNIYIKKRETDGDVVKTVKIPVSYGPKEKFLARLAADPELTHPVASQLPRLGFQITGFNYDAARKLPSTIKFPKVDPEGKVIVYSPVPYDITFQLSIMVRTADDGHQIVEQILPYFTPEWNSSVNLVDEIDHPFDIPLVINSISMEDNYESELQERRILVWTIDFTMKAFFFGPVSTKKVIKIANTNLWATLSPPANTSPDTIINIRPGLTANGDPTTDPDQSIDPLDIDETDNWAYIVTVSDP